MSTIYQNYKPLVIRDNYLFVKGNTKGFQTQGTETGTSEIVGANNNPGSFADVPAVIAIAHNFGEATQLASIRSIDVETLLNYAGSTAFSPSTGNITAIRGASTIAAPTTLTSGFLFGVQGKLAIQGTWSSANWAAAQWAQLDLSATVGITTGQVAALWADCGSTFSAGAISGQGHVDIIAASNTCAGSSVNSVIHAQALATYLLDISNASYPSGWTNTSTVGGATGRVKIKTPAGDAYILVYAAS